VVFEEEALRREQLPLGTRRLLIAAVAKREARANRVPRARAARSLSGAVAGASPSASSQADRTRPTAAGAGPSAAARERGMHRLRQGGVDLQAGDAALCAQGVPLGLRVHLARAPGAVAGADALVARAEQVAAAGRLGAAHHRAAVSWARRGLDLAGVAPPRAPGGDAVREAAEAQGLPAPPLGFRRAWWHLLHAHAPELPLPPAVRRLPARAGGAAAGAGSAADAEAVRRLEWDPAEGTYVRDERARLERAAVEAEREACAAKAEAEQQRAAAESHRAAAAAVRKERDAAEASRDAARAEAARAEAARAALDTELAAEVGRGKALEAERARLAAALAAERAALAERDAALERAERRAEARAARVAACWAAAAARRAARAALVGRHWAAAERARLRTAGARGAARRRRALLRWALVAQQQEVVDGKAAHLEVLRARQADARAGLAGLANELEALLAAGAAGGPAARRGAAQLLVRLRHGGPFAGALRPFAGAGASPPPAPAPAPAPTLPAAAAARAAAEALAAGEAPRTPPAAGRAGGSGQPAGTPESARSGHAPALLRYSAGGGWRSPGGEEPASRLARLQACGVFASPAAYASPRA